jgi:hypothetical protein
MSDIIRQNPLIELYEMPLVEHDCLLELSFKTNAVGVNCDIFSCL